MEQKKEIKIYEKQSVNIINQAEDLSILTDKDMTKAVDYLSEIKTAGKKIREIKELYTKPANEILKNARAMFSPMELNFKKAEMIIKDKMVSFDRLQEEKQKEQIKELENKVLSGEVNLVEASNNISLIQKQERYEGQKGSIHYRINKKIRVIDENIVPREYLILNEKLIREDLLQGKKIKGVELIEEKIVVAQ